MTGENVSSWWKILMLQVFLGNSGEFALYLFPPTKWEWDILILMQIPFSSALVCHFLVCKISLERVCGLESNLHEITVGHDDDFVRFW